VARRVGYNRRERERERERVGKDLELKEQPTGETTVEVKETMIWQKLGCTVYHVPGRFRLVWTAVELNVKGSKGWRRWSLFYFFFLFSFFFFLFPFLGSVSTWGGASTVVTVLSSLLPMATFIAFRVGLIQHSWIPLMNFIVHFCCVKIFTLLGGSGYY
jgi:hypothetical protein